MRFAITAFASRQARGGRQRNRWRASSIAANSSSDRCLTIRCWTMTAIHRSGRCDKRDMKSRRGCRMGIFNYCPSHDHRRESEGRQCATLSPDICIEAQHSYDDRTEPPLRSVFVGRAHATLEKRIPINSTNCYFSPIMFELCRQTRQRSV